MRRLSISAFVGMLALTITGCGSGRAENKTNTSSNTVQPTVKPTDGVEKSAPQTPQIPAQKPTIVAQNPPTPGFSSTAGLIQPTNVNQRTQQVQQGRPDPFAGLFTIPKVVTAKPQKVVPRLPKLPSVAPPPPQPVVVKPTPAPLPAPIEPPQPDLARGVTVLGVVEVSNQLQAIVRVPTEATSRYVTEGQRLSDGQVLVKRIEMSPGSEPVVILEQNGIEVSRAVGEEPVQPEEKGKTGRPTAAILSSPLSQTTSPSSRVEFKSMLQDSNPAAIPVPQLPPTKALKSKSKIAQPSYLPPPPSTSPLPKLQSNSNLPELSPPAVPAPDFPPPAVRTPSPAQQSTTGARIQRQRLIFQLLHSSSQPTSSSLAVKSNSKARTYRQQMLSRILNRP